MFYHGKLEADSSVLERAPLSPELSGFWPSNAHIPIVICDIVGKRESLDSDYKGKANLHSMINKTEAEKVVRNQLNIYS